MTKKHLRGSKKVKQTKVDKKAKNTLGRRLGKKK